MNRHLNIFHTYTKVNREQQLENDLTRALAICLQEDSVFFNTVLKEILDKKSYESLFTDISGETKISIEIQKNVESLEAFNKLYAISITGLEMSTIKFAQQPRSNEIKEHITDLTVLARDIAILVEVKPDDSDCTWQLAQQAYKAIENAKIDFDKVIPVDLNWKQLMALAVQVSNFNRASGNNNRFLNDFIQFIREHNYKWLPVAQFSSLINSMSKESAYRLRMNSALSSISETHEILEYYGRIGLKLNLGWAQEIVFNFDNYNENDAALFFGFWPGNTKGQGTRMFQAIANKTWRPPNTIELQSHFFQVEWGYEIKFCHFNAHISNLVFDDSKVKPGKQILSKHTHDKYSGKYDREYWPNLEAFLDEYLIETFDWRNALGWNTNFVNTGRNYLTLSIGYQIETIVPVSYLQQIDTSQDDLSKLTDLIIEMKSKYERLFED
ncbi:hypothetical protein [Fluviicola taffensis]|uniref:Uncharacterized protein n=1 Tax=Fluviicola taffensis (strain DSM 16823 / NCIMB 13979 / RW262) TaxID=755732 RepID=F2IGS7_FLUTR|nr:hypothetical protein [Fluviicola taffensis]AEA43694.1 hypothetical protein Fluta_1702 [Fluviicola taffensis DSM 16823]